MKNLLKISKDLLLIDDLYERKEYIKKISKYIGINLIKVLVGERRVGKSFIMKTFIKELVLEGKKNNIFYINFEIDDFLELKKEGNLKELFDNYFLNECNKKEKIYVFLDEIQEVERWEIFVNSILAKYGENIEIFISGSNSKLLSSELSTFLSGRYIDFLILPFNFSEYKDFTKKSDFLEYLSSTGLPEALKIMKLNDKEMLRNYFISLKNTIIVNDIVKRYKIRDIFLIEKLFLFLIDNISNFTSSISIVKKLKQEMIKTNHITIGNYILYLKEIFLIYPLEKYDLKGKKILENEKKYYLNDFGFKNFLNSSYDLGLSKNFENYIFLILKRLGYNICIGRIGDLEIDFIGEKNNKKIYVQVSINIESEKVLEREIKPFFKIKDKQECFLVTYGKHFNGIKDGVKILDFEDFELEIV